MKNTGLVILLFTLIGSNLHGQMWDNGWVIGNDDSFNQTTGGGTLIDFRQYPSSLSFIPKKIHADGANSSVSDK
jgi:hypothetical protein